MAEQKYLMRLYFAAEDESTFVIKAGGSATGEVESPDDKVLIRISLRNELMLLDKQPKSVILAYIMHGIGQCVKTNPQFMETISGHKITDLSEVKTIVEPVVDSMKKLFPDKH